MMAPGFDARLGRFILAVLVAVLGISAPPFARPTAGAMARWPQLMLWAWERPEDLRGLPAGVGVAFLAQTINVGGTRPPLELRRQPLRVDRSTALVAVTRIQITPDPARPLADADATTFAALIATTRSMPQVAGLQVDFDATRSQRPFYRQLVAELRRLVGPGMPISVTALASWCEGDRWLDTLDVDEAVPMVFRMGPTNEMFRGLGTTGRWQAAECRGAVGTSLDEPIPLRGDGRRLYVFAPRPWTAASIQAAQLIGR